jgi:hydroxymethylglutaryl-CoA synthase
MKTGIIGYGVYIPKYRIKAEEIANAWNQNIQKIKSGLLIQEKSLPGSDEDSATIAVESSQNALARSNIDKTKIGAIYVGSESHPYAVKPTATIIGSALGIGNNYTAADMEFACKAGTAALQACVGLVKSSIISYGLAIGTDTAQAKPGDVLEYSASAASASFVIGNKETEIVATIDETLSLSSDTPDFWRRNKTSYPSHAGRFTGEPAYFTHTINTTKEILKKSSLSIPDFDHVIFHQPNGKFPMLAAKKLGVTKEQLEAGLLAPTIGNSYSACSLVGLCAVLDNAKPNQKILLVSYGSGSGSDAFVITTTQLISKKQNLALTTNDYIKNKTYVSYEQYKKFLALI